MNLNPMNKEWLVNHKVSDDAKLELRLGPPGEATDYNSNTTHGTKRASGSTLYSAFSIDAKKEFQNLPVSKKLVGTAEDFKQPCSSRMATGDAQFADRKTCSSLATVDPDASTNNTSNKRVAYSPVVGWPPIRSSRKNLASNSLSKPASESSTDKEDTGGKSEIPKTQLYVKINMEGIPIGRKVNLSAYYSYEELSLAIDELFSGLLAAQRDPSATKTESKTEESVKADAGSFAVSGEYTLIYEDDEGDRILVGDVPWHMFVSSAKRLHVLKNSELSTLQICNNGKGKTPFDPAVNI